jgi:hypothetical protein
MGGGGFFEKLSHRGKVLKIATLGGSLKIVSGKILEKKY